MFEDGIVVQTGIERDVMVESGIIHEPQDAASDARNGDMIIMGF